MDSWSIWWDARPRYVRVFLMVLAAIVIALLSARRLREVAGFPGAREDGVRSWLDEHHRCGKG